MEIEQTHTSSDTSGVLKPHLIPIPSFSDESGSLGVLQTGKEIPFVTRRFYFINNVPQGASRGYHSHKTLQQFFCALKGSFTIHLEGPYGAFDFVLDSKSQGLYVPPGYWRILSQFSEDCICGVFASEEFDPEDYIRQYDKFKETLKRPVQSVNYINFDRLMAEGIDTYELQIRNCLKKGVFVLGEQVKELEKQFSHFIGTQHAIGVASGLDALILILKGLGIGKGDEVILPANTFYASALAVDHVGATPVFVDADPFTFNINPTEIEKAVTKNTKVISVTHLYGTACSMDSVFEVAKKYNLFVIEDAAQAHGATYQNKMCGNLSTAAAFSFYPTKNLGAFGDGGMVTTNDAELFKKIQKLRNYGAEKKYYYSMLGYNSRLDEIQAAVLIKKLQLLPSWNARRNELAKIYLEGLKEISEIQLPIVPQDCTSCWHVFPIVVSADLRDSLITFLDKNGVQTNIHYPVPIHLQEAYNHLDYSEGSFPISERLSKKMVSLPLDQYHRSNEILFVIEKIKKFFSNYQ